MENPNQSQFHSHYLWTDETAFDVVHSLDHIRRLHAIASDFLITFAHKSFSKPRNDAHYIILIVLVILRSL